MQIDKGCFVYPLSPAQDKQCHIVINGSQWVGKFAVWSYPMLQPWDIEVWEAVPLPKHAKHVCNNSLCCTRLGPSACAIRGADFDGDVFMFSSDPDLLELLALTPSGRDVPEFSNAVKEVRTRLERTTKQPIHNASDFQRFTLATSTAMPARGLACMYAEMAQHAAIVSPNPSSDGSFVRAVGLAECAHCANDCPKKFDTVAVVHFSQALLANAGLQRNSPRSSSAAAGKLRIRPGDPYECLNRMLPSGSRFGRVWLPDAKVCLSAAAGKALGERIRAGASREDGYAEEAERIALDELGGLIAHKLQRKDVPQPFKLGLNELCALALEHKWRNSPIQSILTLKDKLLR